MSISSPKQLFAHLPIFRDAFYVVHEDVRETGWGPGERRWPRLDRGQSGRGPADPDRSEKVRLAVDQLEDAAYSNPPPRIVWKIETARDATDRGGVGNRIALAAAGPRHSSEQEDHPQARHQCRQAQHLPHADPRAARSPRKLISPTAPGHSAPLRPARRHGRSRKPQQPGSDEGRGNGLNRPTPSAWRCPPTGSQGVLRIAAAITHAADGGVMVHKSRVPEHRRNGRKAPARPAPPGPAPATEAQ